MYPSNESRNQEPWLYKNYYGANANCWWLITTTQPAVEIQISFSQFSLAHGEYVTVCNSDSCVPNIMSATGSHEIPTGVYSSTTGFLKVLFVSQQYSLGFGFTADWHRPTCTNCEAGKWSLSGSTSCTNCEAGKWSPSGSTNSTACVNVTFSTSPMSTTTPIPYGYIDYDVSACEACCNACSNRCPGTTTSTTSTTPEPTTSADTTSADTTSADTTSADTTSLTTAETTSADTTSLTQAMFAQGSPQRRTWKPPTAHPHSLSMPLSPCACAPWPSFGALVQVEAVETLVGLF
jgi:hypothetical protein